MISFPPEAAARRLVEALVARGSTTFFGIPGGPICPVFEAIRVTKGARLIESRHETAAAFAAATYHRMSGKIPVVVVTAGPGITNSVTGVSSAFLERIPMLVIAGDVAWATHGGRLAQDSGLEGLNIDTMFAPITRARIRATASRSVVPQALAALDAATDPVNPGPALFILPLDFAVGIAPSIEVTHRMGVSSMGSPPDPLSVRLALDALRKARNPLLVVGAGCRGRIGEVRDLIDTLHIPFVTTPRAKGFINELHPFSLRNGGMAACEWAKIYTNHGVDACLVLGSDLDDSSVGPTPYCKPDGHLIHVDRDARVFGRNLPTQFGVVADVGLFAEAAARHAAASGIQLNAETLLHEIHRVSPYTPHPVDDMAHPAEFLFRLQGELPTARYITDIGEHMLFAMHYLTATSADQFHIQLNLGSMGSGVAGAVGIALADARYPVVCIVGDGCMQMHGMEALVAIREKLPILFVVFNDGRYNMVHHGMRQIFGEAENYDTPPVDFAMWGASMGLPSRIIRSSRDITKIVLDELLHSGGPALLDVRINPDAHMSGGGRIAALQRMSMSHQG